MDKTELESLSLNEEYLLPDFVDKVEDKYLCSVCANVLQQPMQTQCGHRLCKTCCVDLLVLGQKYKRPVTCPVNEADCINLSTSPNETSKIFPDHGAKREIKNLKVFCANRKHGCVKEMKWIQLKKHDQTCPFIPMECIYCKHPVAGNNMKTHVDTECIQYPVKCQYGCQIKLTRGQLPDHIKSCPLQARWCQYNDCEFKGNEADIKQHLVEPTSMAFHNQKLMEQVSKLKKENEGVKGQLLAVACEKSQLENSFVQLRDEYMEFKQDAEKWEKRLCATQRCIALQMEKWYKVDKNMRKCAKIEDFQRNTKYLQDMKLAENNIEDRLTSLEKQRSNPLPGSLTSEFSQHDRLLTAYNLRLADVDLRLQMLETVSYNGVLMWKIAGYRRRKADAKCGRVISLYSQPFYTGIYGYKMCARVYLNGDGICKGTHMSLFFTLMKNDYDVLLQWPFKQKVTMLLLDQGGTNHIMDAFRPDINSNSFQRPCNERNIPSGCPLFAAQSVIDGDNTPYIRDDAIFIKIQCRPS